MTFLIRTKSPTTDPNARPLVRDALLDGAGGGVSFLHDWTHAFQGAIAAPQDSDVVKDIGETNDGAFAITAGQAVGFSGGGVDFSPLTDGNAAIDIPAAVAADIHGSGQHFLLCLYLRLPLQAEWPPSGLVPFAAWTDTSLGYAGGEIDLLTMGMMESGAGVVLSARRQTAGGTVVDSHSILAAPHFGLVGQLAFWRNATGQGLRFRSAAGTNISTAAAGADNTGDFSGKTGHIGVPDSLWNMAAPGHVDASNFRMYRGFMENLQSSGRDPVTVLDADYARNIERFS